MTAPAGVAAAADEGPAATVRGGAAGAQAAIAIVGRDRGTREILHPYRHGRASRAHRCAEDRQPGARRNSRGVTPKRAEKARVKCAWLR